MKALGGRVSLPDDWPACDWFREETTWEALVGIWNRIVEIVQTKRMRDRIRKIEARILFIGGTIHK